jgi:hypothetical protein
MQTEMRTQLAAAFVMALSLIASGVVAVELTASGGRNRLSYTDVTLEGQPPQVAAGIAMGAFRGLFVNFLWIRANNLKEEGRYYEAMDLAKAITTLQPRFPHVWVFHAWNMAYNISVTTQTPRERWKWVNAGIDLLRKEGIPNNPNDLMIHKELGWFFLHKIGGYLDDANLYYKRQLAAEWTLVLGPPPPPDTGIKDFQTITMRFADWLRPIAEAPESLAELVRAHPRVGELVRRLREESNVEVNANLARSHVVHQAVARSSEAFMLRRALQAENPLHNLVNDPAWQEQWALLLAHLRKRILIDEYHMDPLRMVRYTETYGPIDWRHHAAHGLYWSLRGVENAMLRFTAENKRDFDFVNSNRVVVQALQELWRSGDLFFDFWGWINEPEGQVFYRASPNIHFIESYGDHMMEFVERTVDTRFEGSSRRPRGYSMYAAGYENFRKDAIRFLYRRGQRAWAERMKEELRLWPHANINNPDRAVLFSLDLDQFVKEELKDSLTRPSVAREEVVGALQGAYLEGLLAGDQEVFRAQMEYAALVHRFFFEQQSHKNTLDPGTLRMEQIPRDFRILAGQEFAVLLLMLDLNDAEAIYDAAPRDLRLWGYDVLVARWKEGIDAMADLAGRRFEDVFPEPPGLAEHRRRMQRMQQEQRQRTPAVQPK